MVIHAGMKGSDIAKKNKKNKNKIKLKIKKKKAF